MTPERETKFHPQEVTASIFWKMGWYPHWTRRKYLPSNMPENVRDRELGLTRLD
jgi:hypothetical protein